MEQGTKLKSEATLFRGMHLDEFRFWRDILAAGRFPWESGNLAWQTDVAPHRMFDLLCLYFKEGSNLDYVDDICNGKLRGAQVRMGWMLSEFCTPPAEMLHDPSPENIKAVANRLRFRTMKKVDDKVAWIYRFGSLTALRQIFEHKTQGMKYWGPSWTWETLGQLAEDKWAGWYRQNPAFSHYKPPSEPELTTQDVFPDEEP